MVTYGPIFPDELTWHDTPQFGIGYRESSCVMLHESDYFDAYVHFVDLGDGKYMPLGHMDWFIRTPKAIREIKRLWPAMRSRIRGPLFTMADVDTDPLDRFRIKFGNFVFHSTVVCSDGQTRKLFVHYGND